MLLAVQPQPASEADAGMQVSITAATDDDVAISRL